MSTFESSRPLVGAQALGIARAAYEYALDYAKERQAFGKPIIMNQAIAFKLADMKMQIDAARLLVWRACWMGATRKKFGRQSDVARRLVEVEMRGAIDPEGAAAHIGAVEIEFQDLILGEPGLQPDRKEGFLHLALDGALVVEEQILRQLLADRRSTLPHAAGLCVGDERAPGAGDVDAEMLVEAAVLGGERRLDQVVRKILQRDRVIVLDAAAADRVAVAVEKRHREIGFLQPVVVGGFAKCRYRQRQHQQQAAEPEGGCFGQRFDEDPALPAADIEAVHEGREPLIEFARALAG